MIKNAYWCNKYIDGIRNEIHRIKGELIEIDFEHLSEITSYSKKNNHRPVVLVNCISEKWIYECLSNLERHNIHPLLLAPWNVATSVSVSTISFDFTYVFYSLCQYLFETSHNKIALFGVNPISVNDMMKKDAFAMFKTDYGIDNSTDEGIFWNYGSLEKCCQTFYNKIKDYNSVICTNDVVAVKLINYLKTKNVSVPKKIYVATIGNTILSEFITPSITVAKFDCVLIGKQSVKLYTMLTRNSEMSSISAKISSEIYPRESTENCKVSIMPRSNFQQKKTDEINFYSDTDVSNIFDTENLVSNCDDLDFKILYGMICDKRLTVLANELYTTENTIKYRIKRMLNLTGTASRKELINLFTNLCGF